MKLLGLIGGVSPEATAIYYRLLNEAARARLGPLHSANILLYTLDYGVMIKYYEENDWQSFSAEVAEGARRLAEAGAEAIVICSNTTHIAANAAAKASGLPVIHMLDVLAAAMKARDVKKPLLLGTPVVMSGDHYRTELAKRYAGHVLIPNPDEQRIIGRVILDELVVGKVAEGSRRELLHIIASHDADGVILGCTELCMILSQQHCALPVFDTTALHASAASAFAFGES
ncbi:MAG: amino acid racemase [Pseudomonadota bacterium]